jgi:hypothetical protein
MAITERDALQHYLSHTRFIRDGELLLPVAGAAVNSQLVIPTYDCTTPDPTLALITTLDPAEIERMIFEHFPANNRNPLLSMHRHTPINGNLHSSSTSQP